MKKSLGERFWEKVDAPSIDECWMWLAGKTSRGYGQFYLRRKPVTAHRMAYEMLYGPIPEGHQLHHRCEMRACVNPRHLLPLTPREHGRVNFPEGCCMHGHETVENSYTYLDRRTGAKRTHCRRCQKQRNLKYRAAQRALYVETTR